MATATNLSETIKSNFLKLSGGTLTGNLNIKKGYDALSLTAPSGSTYSDISFKNSSGVRRAFTRVTENDNAIDHTTQIYVSEDSDNTYPINLTLSYSKSTKKTYAKINSAEIVALATSWRSGTSWYRKYSDGWIEQGGHTPRTSDAYISVSFHTAFSTSDPNVQFTRRYYYDNDSTVSQNRTTGVSSVTATGFKCYDNGWSSYGGSVGVWYACGY